MTLRVLHVLCDLSGGGAERLVLELARRASPDLNVQVAVVQPGGTLGPSFEQAGIVVRCAGRTRGHPGIRALTRLTRWCRGFDVVHTHLWAGDAWGRVASVLGGARVRVSTAHNADRDEAPWKLRWTVASSRVVHRTVAVSDAVAQHLREAGVAAERLVTIPNGVDLDRFRTPWTGGHGRHLLAVGRLVPQKGFDVLLEAVAGLGEVTLDIAGEGPSREALQRRAPSYVRFLGEVSDIPARLARADALVVPSRWEGFGLIAAEGLAAGVPIVASAVDGLVEVIGDAGLLVPAEDPMALRDALDRCLTDREGARNRAAQGRARSRRFGIASTVRAYEQLYDVLARDPGVRADRV